MSVLKAFWHRERRRNFGDELTPWLLPKYGLQVRKVEPHRARFFGAGSIAQRVPDGSTAAVWGSGKLKSDSPTYLADARVLALRGPLTGDADVYADPGLLCGPWVGETEKRYPVGVISHYIEPLPHDGHRIDVQAPVAKVIAETAKCERVVSSSLHGLILADSLGIPNRWVYSSRVIGDGFKFRDYAASFGQKIEPEVWRLAPQEQVYEKQKQLVAALEV